MAVKSTPRASTAGGISEKSYLWVWGKTDLRGFSRKRGGPAWNPLLAHSFDTAAVALLLFDDYLAQPTKKLLVETFGAGDPDTARKVVALLVALHDIPGKACSEFQRSFYRDGLRAAAKQWERQARAAGLPLAPDLQRCAPVRHADVTARLLPSLLGCCCRRRCGGTDADSPALHAVADLLGGHHGHIPAAGYLVRHGYISDGQRWRRIHQQLVEAVAHRLDISPLAVKESIATPTRPAVLPIFAGLVVLADWIASNERFFTYRDPNTSLDQWWKNSQTEAAQAAAELLLQRWPTQQTTWSNLFGENHQPRPAQRSVMNLLPAAGPAMVIVEADTGSGKTEAAWWAAHHLTLTNQYHGMYMALPSRAATEQSAERSVRFVSASLGGDGQRANLAIVHGTAAASAVAEELLQAATKAVPQGPASNVDTINLNDDGCPGAVLDDWFLASKRGLISPFGIGTVDQIVLAVQRSRFWFLRLFGLSQKVVIIDEAHAYELYQQSLLSTAITWLADAGASIVILSATLPRAAKWTLAEAWCHGRGVSLSQEEAMTHTVTVIDGAGRARGATPDTVPRSDVLQLCTPSKLAPGPRSHPFERRWAKAVLEEARDGGIVAIVRNRVDSAVELYNHVYEIAPEVGWDTETEIVLLHGRLLERDRNRIQQRLLHLLGPHPDPRARAQEPNPNRPPRLLVIATQVIEQSLDLDFDLMITDLAPIDLLIQRRGRVRRHSVNASLRPAHLAHIAPVRVLWLPAANNTPLVTSPDNLDGAVYAPYMLAATWQLLSDNSSEDHRVVITTPTDTSRLIESAYGDRLQGSSPAADALLQLTWQEMQAELQEEENQARDRAVAAYSPGHTTSADVGHLASGWLNAEEGEEGHPAHLVARSRLGADSYDIICLFQQPDGSLTWDQLGMLPADLTPYDREKHAAQYREQLRQLLLNTIRIPQRWFQSGRWPTPDKWKPFAVGALRRRPTLLFDSDGQCIHGLPGHVTLTQRTGLQKIASRWGNRSG